uniref:Uncharacterized protein n=1 Tax=Rhizophora mucronata TaxID=61149 RepID=A0A2P2N2V5_RHIMU
MAGGILPSIVKTWAGHTVRLSHYVIFLVQKSCTILATTAKF